MRSRTYVYSMEGKQQPINTAADLHRSFRSMPDADTSARLTRFYAPYNARLAKLLHDDGFLWGAEPSDVVLKDT